MRLRHLTSAVQEALQFLVNEAPVISGIQSSYTLVQDQDTVITGAATDAEGDAITWSFEEVLGGETKIVSGAYRDNTQGSFSGAVYVYDADGTNEIKITSSDLQGGDMFGYEVESNGSKIFVAASNDHNANGDDAGAVYIYDMDGTNEVKVTPSTATTGTKAGQTLACSANKFAVGCWSPGKVWVYDADGTNELEITTPALRMAMALTDDILFLGDVASNVIYSYSTTTGNLISSVSPSDQDASADLDFGSQIEIYGSKLVTSTKRTDAVYVYDLDLTNELKITPTQKQSSYNYDKQMFGWAVAINSTKIAVASGVNDDGEVYLYDLDGSNEIRITPETSISNLSPAAFARTVSLSEDKLIVGNDNYNGNEGAFFIYNLDGTYVNTITASDAAANDRFGLDVEAITAFDPSGLAGTTVAQSGNVFTVSHGLQDSNFTLRFKATDSAGNVTSHDATFAFSYTNQAPTVTGISSAYTLVQDQDTVITGAATDAEGDTITWSFEQDMSPGAAEYLALGASPETGGNGFVGLYDVNNFSAAPIQLSLPAGQPEGDHVFPGRNHIAHNGRFVAATNDSFEHSGYTARVHVWDLNNPSADAVTLISPHGSGSYFGESTAMSSDKLFVGTWNSADVSVYDLNDLSAAPTFIPCPDAYDYKFGVALACNSTHLFVGHEQGRYNPNDNQTETGKVHVYDLSTLVKVATLYGDNNEYGDAFGAKIVANDTRVVVGSHGDDTSPGTSAQTGAVYVFDATDLSASGTKLTPAGGYNDQYGRYFSLSNTHLAVGESGRSSYASNGGAIHIYDLSDLSAAPTMYYGDANQYISVGILINDNDKIAIRKKVNGTIRYKFEVYSLSNLSTPLNTIESGITQNRDAFGIANAVISEMPTAIASQGVTVSQADNAFTVSHGTQDAEFTLKFIATDINGNASEAHSADFSFSYINQAPTISGISSVYTLTQGQDTVITASATDADGDSITWSYSLTSGNMRDTSVSQAGNVFTITPGATDATFEISFIATDSAGKVSSIESNFTYDYIAPADPYWFVSTVQYGRSPSNLQNAGLVLLAEENGTQTVVHPSGSYTDQLFGSDIDASSTHFVVGNAHNDAVGDNAGAIFLFDRNGTQIVRNTSPYAAASAQFGSIVAIRGNKYAGYAPNNGSQYILVYDVDNTSAAPVKIDVPANMSTWGNAGIAITDNKIFVAAVPEDGSGNIIDDGVRLYSYNFDGSGETIVATGTSLGVSRTSGALYGSAVVHWDDTNDKIVLSVAKDDTGAEQAGSIFIMDQDGSNVVTLRSPSPFYRENFGYNLGVSGGYLVTATYSAWNSGTNDYLGSNVYVYSTSGGALLASWTKYNLSGYGQSSTIAGDKIVIGSPYENNNEGVVYLYNLDGTGESRVVDGAGSLVNGLARFGQKISGPSLVQLAPANTAPTVSGIDASYTMVPSSGDTVISATATDADGDPVTFTYAITSGSVSDTSISQDGGTFTITSGSTDTSFQMTITATDAQNNQTDTVTSVAIVTPVPVQYAITETGNNGTVFIYDNSDLTTPVSTVSGSGEGFGESVVVENNKLFAGRRLNGDAGARSGKVSVFDLGNLSAPSVDLAPSNLMTESMFGLKMASGGGKVYFGSPEWGGTSSNMLRQGIVYVYDADTLQLIQWLNSPISGSSGNYKQFGGNLLYHNAKLYVQMKYADGNLGAVYVYDTNDLSAAPFVLKPSGGAPAWSMFGGHMAVTGNDKLIVGTNKNEMYMFDTNNLTTYGQFVPRPSGVGTGNNDRFGQNLSAATSGTHSTKFVTGANGYGYDQESKWHGAIIVYDTDNLSNMTLISGDTMRQYLDNPAGDSIEFGAATAIDSETDRILVRVKWGDVGATSNAGVVLAFDMNNLSAAPTKMTSPAPGQSYYFGYDIEVFGG